MSPREEAAAPGGAPQRAGMVWPGATRRLRGASLSLIGRVVAP